jgi:PadR family transcriptional regulator PadR
MAGTEIRPIVTGSYRKEISTFDMNEGILRHLYLGFMRLHVLYHANKEPISGVELMEELREHGYDVGPGTLYPMLQELERQGLLTREDAIVGGRRRKCARITRQGRLVLAEAREKIVELAAEIVDDVDNRKKPNQPSG